MGYFRASAERPCDCAPGSPASWSPTRGPRFGGPFGIAATPRYRGFVRYLTSLGSVFALLGVAAGAFGAHALRGRLDPDMLQVWETAARYQLVHALALLFLGANTGRAPRGGATAAGVAFVVGVVLFCGSDPALGGCFV